MKIVFINGSPRTNGSTAAIMHIMQQHLQKKEDVDIAFYNLSELNFSFCKGCCSCFQTSKCIIDDDLEKLSQTLALADGVVIGSPTYASNVSGQLKTLIDRGHMVMEQSLYRKYTIGIITGENYGASAAAGILRNVFSYSGAFVTAILKCKLPFTHSPLLDIKISKKAVAKAERLYTDVKGKHQYWVQKIVHHFIFRVGIRPFAVKKGMQYQGAINSLKNHSLLN